MVTVDFTEDEFDQVKYLIERSIKEFHESDGTEDYYLDNYNLNTMEFLLIRLKSK